MPIITRCSQHLSRIRKPSNNYEVSFTIPWARRTMSPNCRNRDWKSPYESWYLKKNNNNLIFIILVKQGDAVPVLKGERPQLLEVLSTGQHASTSPHLHISHYVIFCAFPRHPPNFQENQPILKAITMEVHLYLAQAWKISLQKSIMFEQLI